MTEASESPLPTAATCAMMMVAEWWASRAVLTTCRGQLSPIEDFPFFLIYLLIYLHEFGVMDSYFINWVLSLC